MRIRARRLLAVIAMVTIVLLLGLAFLYDQDHHIDQMRGQMAAQASALVDVIAESSGYGLELYNGWENTARQLRRDRARWKACLDTLAAGKASSRQRIAGWKSEFGATAEVQSPSSLDLGPGRFLRTLGAEEGVHYVVVQNEQGIQASSAPGLTVPAMGDDASLEPLFAGQTYVTREYLTDAGPILEVARIAFVGARTPVLLRVGLDAGPLEAMRRDTLRHTWTRLAVLLASIVVFLVLLQGWQRQSVLDREVERVTGELMAKEEEVRRAEKAAAMGNLAAGVAHQVRNPLNGIHMLAQLLGRREDLPIEAREEIDRIRDESGRIENIVQQFLRYARPRDPELVLENLVLIVQEIVAVQMAVAPSCRIEIIGPQELPIVTDRGFVIEIVENLLRNAAEAMTGGGRVRVEIRAHPETAEIVVADDGPGIGQEDRERIFDLYYTTRPEGSGLGLSLAARMTSALGGALRLDPGSGLDGNGACFRVELPRDGRN